MQFGAMRHRITILKPVCKEDEFGGTSMHYEEDGRCWAEFFRPSFHNQSFEGDGDAAIITQGIRIRPREIKRGFCSGRNERIRSVTCG